MTPSLRTDSCCWLAGVEMQRRLAKCTLQLNYTSSLNVLTSTVGAGVDLRWVCRMLVVVDRQDALHLASSASLFRARRAGSFDVWCCQAALAEVLAPG